MPPVDPNVSKMFGRHLRVWQEALTRWTVKCKGDHQERRTLEATGGLVADGTPNSRVKDFNPTLNDATPIAKPSGLTPEVEERLRHLESRLVRCDSAIREIQTIIGNLLEAMKSGTWKNRQQLWTGFREQPKFNSRSLGRISRDESVVVLAVKGEWWLVRNKSGVEGWIHQGEIAPRLPIEPSSKAGPSDGEDAGDDWTGGRG